MTWSTVTASCPECQQSKSVTIATVAKHISASRASLASGMFVMPITLQPQLRYSSFEGSPEG